jgi:predicted RNase H-like HicB family nuclease
MMKSVAIVARPCLITCTNSVRSAYNFQVLKVIYAIAIPQTAILDIHNVKGIFNMRNVILRQGEDGYIVVECPSLPGCISQGKTEEEALANIKEAIELWIEDAGAHGEAIPEDTEIWLAEV